MEAREILEALESWSLQTLLDVGILVAFLGLGVALAGRHVADLRRGLSLRVSAEFLDLGAVLAVDLALAARVVVGWLVLNPDVMADIKVAIPFMPVATLFYAAALVLRLFHGGHRPGRAGRLALAGYVLGVLLDGLSYSLVLEGPGEEWLARHPSPTWAWVHDTLRSNGGPGGADLAWTTFLATWPVLLAIFAWAAVSGLRAFGRGEDG